MELKVALNPIRKITSLASRIHYMELKGIVDMVARLVGRALSRIHYMELKALASSLHETMASEESITWS